MRTVRDFYERHPYPPVPALAQPRRGEGGPLRYEVGAAAAGAPRPHDGLRIAVLGGGTLEPLVVARAHPRAREVVAVDLSRRSLAVLRRRVGWARATGALLFRGRLPPLRTVAEDLASFSDGPFDYVVATDVLHHHEDPIGLLRRVAGTLAPGGVLRLVTYPRQSRLWLRATGRWLRGAGLSPETPSLVRAARERIGALAADHPVRLSFEENPESRVAAGVADAYLHPCENPRPPAEWAVGCAAAGLELVAEGQSESSRSGFLDEIAPALTSLSRWEKLQVLDDLLELAANPVLWLVKRDGHGDGHGDEAHPPAERPTSAFSGAAGRPPGPGLVLGGDTSPEEVAARRAADDVPLWLPSDLHVEMADGLRRVAARTEPLGVDVRDVVAAQSREVGPRVARLDPTRELPCLTIGERDADELLALPRPFGAGEFAELARRLSGRLVREGEEEGRGEEAARAAERWQVEVGAGRAWIGPLRWRV